MRTVISYDVSDDRKRYKLARVMLDLGDRVQKSVFEVPRLDRAAYLRLRSRAEGIIDTRTDSLRYYRLCRRCAQRIDHCGAGVTLIDEPEDFEIVV